MFTPSKNVTGIDMKNYRFGVVLSTAQGNSTRFAIFKKYAERERDVDFTWAPVKHYLAPGERDPFRLLPRGLKNRAIVLSQAWPVLRRFGSFDAVLIHMYEVDILTALRSYFFPSPVRVLSTDDAPVVDPVNYPVYPDDLKKPAWKRAVRLQLDLWRARRADLMVPLSNWTADVLVRLARVPGNRVFPLHVGLDLEHWTCPETGRRQEAGRRVQLLFVGGEFERKGGHLLLQAFSQHFSQVADLHLVTRAAPASLPDHVYLHDDLNGNDERLKQLYQRADILVHPTTCDLSSWVVLEAMASGCAVVTTRMAGITELVQDGRSGLLVNPGDAEALTAALKTLIADPELRRSMGVHGRHLVEHHFNAAINVPKIIRHMKSAVDQRHSPVGSLRAN